MLDRDTPITSLSDTLSFRKRNRLGMMLIHHVLQAAVARMSALTRSQARAAHPLKEYPVKTRGKKAGKTSAATKKEDEDVIELD